MDHIRGDAPDVAASRPYVYKHGILSQAFGTVRLLPIGLSESTCLRTCTALNQLLADSMVLYGLYKKYHWQVCGPTFYQLHLLLDEHAGAQLALIDAIAERIQMLGGVAVGDVRHAAETTTIERPPDGTEVVAVLLERLLTAHERIIDHVRDAIELTAASKDSGSNDLLAGEVLRTNEQQLWYLSAQLAHSPLVLAYPVPVDGAAALGDVPVAERSRTQPAEEGTP